MPRLSNSPRTPFTFDLERRKSYTFRLNLLNGDKTPVDLTGATLRFVVKDRAWDDDQFDITNLIFNSGAEILEPTDGYGTFIFQAAELDWDPGAYFYAIVLWAPDGFSGVVLKGAFNLLENTESDSMHISYVASSPPSEIEVALRGNQVVNVYTQNLGMDAIHRGPCIRTTEAAIDPHLNATTQLAISQVVQQAYPTGGLVELRPGDLVFQAGLVGAVVAGRIFSVGDTNFQMTTVLGTEAEVL